MFNTSKLVFMLVFTVSWLGAFGAQACAISGDPAALCLSARGTRKALMIRENATLGKGCEPTQYVVGV
jgi:hypothetical protein